MMYKTYGNQLFFSISIERDPSFKSDVIIRLKPGNLGMPLHYYGLNETHPVVIAYKRMLSDVTSSLGSTLSYNSNKYAEQLYYLEKMMANVTLNIEKQNDLRRSLNIVTLDQLRIFARGLPIHDILSSYFQEVHITPSTRIWIPSGNYFERISDVLGSFDKTEIFNAMTMSTLQKFLPYQSKYFTHGWKHYLSMITGRDHERKPRWEFCSSLIFDLTPMAFEGLIQRGIHKSDYEKNKNIINDMYENIKFSIIKTVHESRIKDVKRKNILMESIKSISLQVGLPSVITGKSCLDKYHSNLQVIYDNLNQNVIHGIQFKRMKMQSILNGEGSKNESLYLSILSTMEVKYCRINNVILVPQYLINLPHYHQDYAIPIIYGRLGVMIAEALSAAIYYSYGAFQFDRRNPKYIHDANITAQRQLYECMESSSFPNLFDRDTSVKLNITNLTLSNTLTHINGVKFAANGLKRKIDSYSNKKHLEHISGLEEYEINEIFYLSYAQSKCSLQSSSLDRWHAFTQFILRPKELMKLVWMYSNDFPRGFLCPISPTVNRTCLNIKDA